MKGAPSQKEMMDPGNPQAGQPNYMDDSVENPKNDFYPNRGEVAPAYKYCNPRYREYR
jgi:hypothetical protein